MIDDHKGFRIRGFKRGQQQWYVVVNDTLEAELLGHRRQMHGEVTVEYVRNFWDNRYGYYVCFRAPGAEAIRIGNHSNRVEAERAARAEAHRRGAVYVEEGK